ncbi:MAG: hypothetical protein PHR27_10815 [Candidatus Cloacimonetes bacterium]|nr:hypothetical protein [Candidatus Cloacimonadota bacterium]
MGTQQILLIVLSVIIVGAAIAVGIQMFNSQAYSANKSALAADAQSFATQVVQYYKTPTSQGGAGKPTGAMLTTDIGKYIGWVGANSDSTSTEISTESGNYKLAASTATTVTILGLGKELRGGVRPAVRTIVTLPEGTIAAELIDTKKTYDTLDPTDFD